MHLRDHRIEPVWYRSQSYEVNLLPQTDNHSAATRAGWFNR